MTRLALPILASLTTLFAAANAAQADLPGRVDIAVRRPGNKALFVHVELITTSGKTRILGCQTSSKDKRCTRRRTRVPATDAQLSQLKQLWAVFAKRGECLLRRLPESWGRIWIVQQRKKDKTFTGPMVPARDHASLKSPCLQHAKIGWWVLDRYDRRK